MYNGAMTILVTGADGFLGGHITSILLQEGHTVRALYHPASSCSELPENRNLGKVEGNLLEPGSLHKALENVDAVVHAAASTMMYPRRSRTIWEINFQGTRNLAEAAAEHRVKRFVSIGTANSFGAGSLEAPGTEKTPYNHGRFGADYMDSKKAVQDWLIEFHSETGFPVVIINPCYMLGSGDSKPGSGAMMLRLRGRKRLPISRGGKNFVAVKDVARAAVNALQMGRTGECYICGNENLPYSRAFPLFAEVMGMKVSSLKIAAPFVLVYGFFNSLMALISGKEPNISLMMARTSIHNNYYSPEKARRELKLPETPVQTAAAEAYEWFQENGYCD